MKIRRKQQTGRHTHRIKQVGDEPEADDEPITVLVSTDAMDKEGDIVEQDWSYDDPIRMFWRHKSMTLPLGHWTNPRVVSVASLDVEVSEDAERALLLDSNFDMGMEMAAAVKRKMRRGDIQDVSVGFDFEEMDEFDDDEAGRFRFVGNTLKEVSVLNFGANQDTQPLEKALHSLLPDALREGQRNSELDAKAMGHAREMIEFCLGEREEDGVGSCPFHTGGMDDDDKSGGRSVIVKELTDDVAGEAAGILESMRAAAETMIDVVGEGDGFDDEAKDTFRSLLESQDRRIEALVRVLELQDDFQRAQPAMRSGDAPESARDADDDESTPEAGTDADGSKDDDSPDDDTPGDGDAPDADDSADEDVIKLGDYDLKTLQSQLEADNDGHAESPAADGDSQVPDSLANAFD